MSNEVVTRDAGAVVTQQPGELSISQVLGQLAKIQDLMRQAMVKDVDYGTIPGTPKPTLYKPGAEKLCLMFRLDPEYEMVKDIQDGTHLSIVSRCVLYHIPTGARMGSGMGSCSTHEKKYAYRNSERFCPDCGVESIMKAKAPKTGYYCWAKKGGCGSQFEAGDERIEEQEIGKVDNPDIADQYNTVLKMANKRAQVAAVLNVTGASQIFTQDVEDFAGKAARASAAAGQEDTGVAAARDPRPSPAASRLKDTDLAPKDHVDKFLETARGKCGGDEMQAGLIATALMHNAGCKNKLYLKVGQLKKMIVELTKLPDPKPEADITYGEDDPKLGESFDKAHPVEPGSDG